MKARYREFCTTEGAVPLFSQAWWLDAVAGDANWDVALVESGGQVVGAMPYVLRRRYGFRVSGQPPLTQTLGPWLRTIPGKSRNDLARQKDIMGELIDQLPPVAHFVQNWHPTVRNWLPFYWRGFRQTTRYTYALNDLTDLDRVWSGISQNIRTDIRKADNRFGVRVRDDLGIDALLALNRKTFARIGRTLPYPESLVVDLDAACGERGVRRILIAEDAEGRHHAGAFVVWDRHSAYYLIGGGDPGLRNSGATSQVLWEAIRFAATVVPRFDFEGSMLEPVERFFRGFGGEQVPYFQVSRTPSRVWRALEFARSLRDGVGR